MKVACTALVPERIARSFPSRPDRVNEAMLEAAKSMEELAGERKRTLAEPPRLVETRETGLGFVELSFEAETRPL